MGEHEVSPTAPPDAGETAPLRESDMIRVAIVDDHPLARCGLEQILSGVDGLTVVASVASVAELAPPASLGPEASERCPDVLLLDLYHDGDLPCLSVISELGKATRVLVVSASGRSADVLGAIRAGASGYLTKHSSPAMIVSALETVAAGGFSLSSQLADILQAELAGPAPGDVADADTDRGEVADSAKLSPREEETLGLIARGFTHAQAARRMSVTKATVDTYVERIRAKLQVGNKAELTSAALRRLGKHPAPR